MHKIMTQPANNHIHFLAIFSPPLIMVNKKSLFKMGGNKVAGNRVTLGVEAPDHVRILRGELEQVVCAFDDPEEEEVIPDVFAQTVGIVQDSFADTIPFVPSVAR